MNQTFLCLIAGTCKETALTVERPNAHSQCPFHQPTPHLPMQCPLHLQMSLHHTLPMFITPPPNAHYITLPLQYPLNHHLQRTNAHHITPPPNAIIYRTSQFHHPTLSIPITSPHPLNTITLPHLSMPITSPHQCPLHHPTSNTITLPHFPIDARYDTPLLVPIASPHCLLHHLPMLITSLHPPNAITSPYLLMPLHHYTLPVPYYITTPINAHYITPPQWPLHRFPIPLHVHHPPSQCPLHHPTLPMFIASPYPSNANYITPPS